MDITPQIPKDKNNILAYGPEGFKINQTLYKSAIILSPEKILEIDIAQAKEINLEVLNQILNFESEILLIGTGKSHLFIEDDLKEQIKSFYPLISIDEMTSAAACRTYNILMVEGRKVVAILIPL